jgi:hypothetical protein
VKSRIRLICVTVLTLFAVPTALASTTWYVNGVRGRDSNNCKSPTTACKTIGHATSLAASGDSIVVAAATYSENLGVTKSLSIKGAGASTTIIDGGRRATVVTISNTSAHVTLSRLTIQDGLGRGGGVYNPGTLTVNYCIITGNFGGPSRFDFPAFGGGIYNSGTMTINNTTINGNRVFGNGGWGGGIYNAGGALTINNSTINANTAYAAISNPGRGGGIYSNGRAALTINNSTINGNGAVNGEGGGILNSIQAPLTISNTTISGNNAKVGGGVFNNFGSTTVLQNSIVANNPAGGDCSGDGTTTSRGFNLSSDATCDFDGPGDLNNTNPLLGPLQNNGGPTPTQALLTGSPAIDAGNPSGCTDGSGHLLKTDQRAMPRPDKEDTRGCDMGAYERQSD